MAFSCTAGIKERSEFALGTVCAVRLFENAPPELFDAVFKRLSEIEDVFSATKEGSELSLVNKNAGLSPVKVSADFIEVLGKALFYAALSFDGEYSGFDPAVGALVKLWGVGTEEARVPSGEEIKKALTLVDWRLVRLDAAAGTVFLPLAGMALDLGGIAKGYAADEAVKILKNGGVESAIIDFGGNIFALGEKPPTTFMGKLAGKKGFYKIGIQDPAGVRGSYIKVLEIKNKTVVTSGNYERFFEKDGEFYHHILSAKTGYPVANDLSSVTVIASRSIDADALSTTLYVAGFEKGGTLLKELKRVEPTLADTEAVFVFGSGAVETVF